MAIAFFQQLAQALTIGPVVVATVARSSGSVPREVGAKLFVYGPGQFWGTIGGGAGEAKVIRQALTVLATGQPQWVEIDLSGAAQRQTEGICGGRMGVWLARWQGQAALSLVQTILTTLRENRSLTLVTPYDSGGSTEARPFILQPSLAPQPEPGDLRPEQVLLEKTLPGHVLIEQLEPAPSLLIIGAGHCGLELAKVAHLLEFQVLVQDERCDWANKAHYPNAAQIFTGSVGEAVSSLTNHTQLYAALVTRGYQQDLQALQALLERATPCAYIGMIGSQKRVRRVLNTPELAAHFGPDARRSLPLYGPIGLDIGALTPAEIAVSIAAELVMVRRGGRGGTLSGELPG